MEEQEFGAEGGMETLEAIENAAGREPSGRLLAICSCAKALTRMSQILRARGFEVDIADSVETALEWVPTEPFDGVLVESSQFVPLPCRQLKERFGAPVMKFTKRRTGGEIHAVAAAITAFTHCDREFPRGVHLSPSQVRQAREIQTSLMPNEAPRLHGWELQFGWQPFLGVGGDLCWFSERDDSLMVALADVQGKGFPAAILTGMIGSLLDGIRSLSCDAISHLNERICARTPLELSVAVTLLELRPDTAEIRFCNAGNPPPIIFNRGLAPGWEQVQPALGWLEEYQYKVLTASLEPDQILAIFSDGLETDRLECLESGAELELLVNRCLDQAEADHPDDRAVILLRRA